MLAGGVGGVSGFTSAGDAGVGAGGWVSLGLAFFFTFFLAFFFAFFGKISPRLYDALELQIRL